MENFIFCAVPQSEVEILPDVEVVHFNIRTWVEKALVRKNLKSEV